MTKHTILFLAANPGGTDRRALDREARAIRAELQHSGHRDRFEFETRWAAEPLDLLRALRDLRPLVVHFSGHGDQGGLFFQAEDGSARVVSTAALADAFAATGGSVRLVVLSACYSGDHADALLAHVDHVVGMGGAIHEDAARSFAIGFYGGLGEGEPVDAAYRQGCAAIHLQGLPDGDRPQLWGRGGIDASRPLVTEDAPAPTPQPPPAPRSRLRQSAIVAGLAVVGLAVVLVAVRAIDGHGDLAPELEARLDAVKRRLAGFGDPPPPPACAPAAAIEAGELILTARDQIASDADAALAAAARAIDRCPTWAAGHNVHGNALAKAKRFEDAVASYARALRYAPDYDAPRFNLGVVQLRLQDPVAIATFTELIARKPDYPDVYNARGKAYLFAKMYREALLDLEEAVRRKPDDGIAWKLVGELREQLGRKDAPQAFCSAAELGIEGASARCRP